MIASSQKTGLKWPILNSSFLRSGTNILGLSHKSFNCYHHKVADKTFTNIMSIRNHQFEIFVRLFKNFSKTFSNCYARIRDRTILFPAVLGDVRKLLRRPKTFPIFVVYLEYLIYNNLYYISYIPDWA